MHTVEDYLAKVQIEKILYINKIPLEKVILSEIPKLNPLTLKYKQFWVEETRKCIDGFWVEHNKEWKYVPGMLYFYGTHWHILLNEKGGISKTKKIARPLIRDLEWIKFYLLLEARGFSGFSEDEEYTCHREVALPEDERTIEFMGKGCYNSKGQLKKYIPAREYLYKYFTKPLGKPLYENMAQNVVDLESRGGGKSYTMSGISGGNFTFDGAQDFEEYWSKRKTDDCLSSETLIGAIDSKYSGDLIKKIKLGLESFTGEFSLGDKVIPAPFSKSYTGQWESGKTIIQEVEKKVGGQWKRTGTRSKIQHRTFMDNEFAANGTRGSINILDEVGFMYNLKETLVQMKECTADGALKFGVIWMCVCEGTKVWTRDGRYINIEDLKKEDGIVGWDENTKSSAAESIINMFPPIYKQCVKITTNTGRILECSEDHPILWAHKSFGSNIRQKEGDIKRKFVKKTIFKEAASIVIGDQIAIAESVNIFGDGTIWNPRLVGMLIGDGSYGFNKTPVLSNCDNELNTYTESLVDTIVERSHITKDGRIYKETRLKGICKHLRDLGIYGQTKLNKRLPDKLNTSTEYTVTELLGGLYDTEGYVTIQKNGKVQIGLTSSSDILLTEVRAYLQKLGIHGSIKKRYPRIGNRIDKNIYYTLLICDNRSIILFAEKIKLLVKYKQDNLTTILNTYKDKNIRKAESVEGIRFERVENIEFIGVKKVYNVTVNRHNTYMANGIITHNCGTGGDMEGGSTGAVMSVFYDPRTYDCIPFEDYYENSGKEIGFFIPAWMTLNQFKDELGNTNYKSAIQYLLNVRAKLAKGKDRSAYDGELCQRPIIPSEVFLISGGNILPTGMLKDVLSELETSNDPNSDGVLGHMSLGADGKPKFIVDTSGELRDCDWPVKKGENHTGAIRVWEPPTDNVGFGYYLAGNDPYDQDKAPNSVSLGSLLIMKRACPGISPYDAIVAEYTARPETAREYYEQCRLLLMWYNTVGSCLYENEKIGIKTYLENTNCLYLFASTPSILKSNQTSNVNRGIGQHMSTKVKDEAEIMLRDWLVAPAGDGKLNLHNIKSKPLLKELINYNKLGNFDRCFTENTMITTDGGLKEIKYIKEGDKVLTHKGRFRKVTKHSGHLPEDKELLSIDIHSNIDSLKLTKNHPVYSIKVKRNGVPSDRVTKVLTKGGNWYKAEELVKGDLVLLPKRRDLKKTELSEDMLYLLGWYISDGWASTSTDNAVTICLHITQEEMADKLCTIINKFCNGEKKPNMKSLHAPAKKEIRPGGKECILVSIKSKKLKNFLQYYGGVSYNKYIHKDLYNSSGLLPLIVGFLEGDGHQKIDKNKRNIIEVVSVYKLLILQVRQILIDNDIYSSLCVKNTNSERKNQYSLQISGRYVLPIVNKSLKFKLDIIYTKDKNFAYKTEEGFWVPIKKISTFSHEGLVYNFSVEEDETYVASGIVVHNCIALMLCIIQMTQMHKIVVERTEEAVEEDPFFSRPLFGSGFW